MVLASYDKYQGPLLGILHRILLSGGLSVSTKTPRAHLPGAQQSLCRVDQVTVSPTSITRCIPLRPLTFPLTLYHQLLSWFSHCHISTTFRILCNFCFHVVSGLHQHNRCYLYNYFFIGSAPIRIMVIGLWWRFAHDTIRFTPFLCLPPSGVLYLTQNLPTRHPIPQVPQTFLTS